MSTTDGAEPTHVRLMNEYTIDVPLWVDGAQTDGEELDLTDGLRSELRAFAARWEATVPWEIFDDRFHDEPVRQWLLDAGRALRRWLRPSDRAAAKAEDGAIRRQGEELRERLAAELGEGYVVTYDHW